MEKILEILKKHIKNKLFDEPLTDDDPKYLARKRIMKVDGYEDAAKEIYELYYEREFVEWLLQNRSEIDRITEFYPTTEKIYSYWKTLNDLAKWNSKSTKATMQDLKESDEGKDDVINRRELLIDFLRWMQDEYMFQEDGNAVDEYLQSINSL